jgi:nucleoside 2-deoxyribosyltransferase
MKVYIAGKITGDPKYRQKFERAAAQLKKQGMVVLNPAAHPDGMSRADYMRIDLAMIDSAEMVFFLRDWTDSEGARLEYQYCRYIGKQTACLDGGEPVR